MTAGDRAHPQTTGSGSISATLVELARLGVFYNHPERFAGLTQSFADSQAGIEQLLTAEMLSGAVGDDQSDAPDLIAV
ncbi:hypothetical protein ACU4GR_11300 [Methylobacterium oryzae CBMB20]